MSGGAQGFVLTFEEKTFREGQNFTWDNVPTLERLETLSFCCLLLQSGCVGFAVVIFKILCFVSFLLWFNFLEVIEGLVP